MAKKSPRVLIVDDEEELVFLLERLMSQHGFTPIPARDGATAIALAQSERPDLALVDFKMSPVDGMTVLQEARKIDPELPVVIITAYADVRSAVDAMKAGAYDFLSKPFQHEEVVALARRAIAERNLRREAKSVSGDEELRELMGPGAEVEKIAAQVHRVAKSNFSIVILGETGSGKEVIARAVHRASPRAKGPFIPVDCGAIPEALIESELFGHEKGAFTGAVGRKRGKFEAAEGGTLFLDEISNMPLAAQAKLLRVLQERSLYRVGGTESVPVDVRVLVASNQDPRILAASGAFRHDLFFRLGEFMIHVPPLRERPEDIPYLAKRFLDIANVELEKNVTSITEPALEALRLFDWPGNVRQLRSTIRRAVLLAEDSVTEAHLDIRSAPVAASGPTETLPLKEIVRRHTAAVERDALIKVLRDTKGNKAHAARLLQIDYKTIHTKIKEYGIDGG